MSPSSKGKAAPSSINQRIFTVLALGVVLAQLLSTVIWSAQWKSEYEQRIQEMGQGLAGRVVATAEYFIALPHSYRRVVLDQLRDMGGTRFFVTLNETKIDVLDRVDSNAKLVLKDQFEQVFSKQLTQVDDYWVEFSLPSDLHVLNNQTLLGDIPDRWGRQTLSMEPFDAPILVVQIPIAEGQWLYVATVTQMLLLEKSGSPLSRDRVMSLVASFVAVMLLGVWVVRSLTLPMRELGKASEYFGRGELYEVSERGSSEVQAVTRAFNAMQQKIQRYLNDRERLFAAISHDLKTPITRMRLRAEMLEDERSREAFSQDLEDMDLMVKGAIQSVKDTDIHENQTDLNVHRMLVLFRENAILAGHDLQLRGDKVTSFVGKPLALKRCIGNVLDNAFHYGDLVIVETQLTDTQLCIDVVDNGPGIPEGSLTEVFQPYKRLRPNQGHAEGQGLGLAIARNIARANGGDIKLQNRKQRGLRASLVLPVRS